MKLTILLFALAAVLTVSDSTPTAKATRQNLIIGNIISGDRLLSRAYVQKYAVPNAIQTEDLIYRGALNTRITSIRCLEVGFTQYGRAQLAQGGIGWANATIRFTSARGYGYYYQVEIWGR